MLLANGPALLVLLQWKQYSEVMRSNGLTIEQDYENISKQY